MSSEETPVHFTVWDLLRFEHGIFLGQGVRLMGELGVVLLTVLVSNVHVVMPVGEGESIAAVAGVVEDEFRAKGEEVLEPSALLARLVGDDALRDPKVESIGEMLSDADQLEGHFDTVGANELRQRVLDSFLKTPRPSARQRELTARAAHDLMAGWLVEGEQGKAKRAARYALAHFNSYSLEPGRYSPVVRAFFQKQRGAFRAEAGVELTVTVQRPGVLYIDGDRIGDIQQEWVGLRVAGSYRVWVLGADGWSLPYPVVLESSRRTLRLKNRVEHCWTLTPSVRWSCEESYRDAGRVLLERLGATHLTLVRMTGEGTIHRRDLSAAGESEEGFFPLEPGGVELFPQEAVAASRDPMRYAPLGLGQLVQGRPAAGVAWMAAQAGLLAWHVTALMKYRDLKAQEDYNSISDARDEQNLSAGMVYGAMILGVLEAIVSEPEGEGESAP